jgi:serine/threonine protein kinase/tetratricopeptide (TPR) repeat protein
MADAIETQATTGSGSSGPQASAAEAQAPLEGDRFGPYRVVRLIGEGGMGSVYLAEQSRPIHREVALKVVKLGMDTQQVVARFESERQALALMDHPNIAHVYEAGTSELGRPYFVMEYVNGVPVTNYCDEHLLSTRERLELFGQVCLALQHAHQKGVIHRDIKPSNVLVTVQDDKPFPKVIDFGIAKATDQRLAEHSAFTLMGHFAGTPEYMSPEQADLRSQDIDTTTDVYSLGVLLYELLVGALPFDGRWLREAGMAELLRIIREEEAPTPSDKLTTLGDTVTRVARCRRTDPITLRRQLAGDVNWIVMKALEKDRQHRYPSVSELAADIRRHLEDLPVLAGPPSKLYRVRKFVRRHRVAVSAGALVAASLVAGIVAVGWEARVAEERRRDAENHRARAAASAAQASIERGRAEDKAREAETQRAEADAQRLEAEAQRGEAEELYGGVRDLANSMLFDIAEQISELQGATAARETLIRKGVEYLNRLSKDPRATPEVRRELADAYLRIGDLQGRTVHPNLGDPSGAFESYQKSVALLEPLAKASPHDPKLTHLLVQAYRWRGRMQADRSAGDADFARSIALAEVRVNADPKSQEARHDLASSLAQLSSRGMVMTASPEVERSTLRAKAIFEELLRDGATDPDIRRELAWQHQNLGTIEIIRRNPQRALEHFTVAVDQFASLVREFPHSAVYRHEHAGALLNASNALLNVKRTQEAIEYRRRAVAITQQLVEGDERSVNFRGDVVSSQMALAFALRSAGNNKEASDLFLEALAGSDRLVAEQPANANVRYGRVETLRNIARIDKADGNPQAALDHQRKAEADLQELLRQQPDRTEYRSAEAGLQTEIGTSLADRGDYPGALAEYRRALADLEHVAAGKGAGDAAWGAVASGHYWIAYAYGRAGDATHQKEELRIAADIFEKGLAADPNRAEFRSGLASVNSALATSYAGDRNASAAMEVAGKSLAFLESEYAANPASFANVSNLAQVLRQMSEASYQQNDLSRSTELRRRVVEIWEQFAALEAGDATRAHMLANAVGYLGFALADAGDRKGCLDASRRVREILDRFKVGELSPSVRRSFAFTYANDVQLLSMIHEVPAAVAESRKVLPIWEDVHAADPKDTLAKGMLVSAQGTLAANLLRLGDFTESLNYYQRALELQLQDRRETSADWRVTASLQERIGVLRGLLGNGDAMEQGLRESVGSNRHGEELAEQIWKKSPAAATAREVASTETALAFTLFRLGDRRGALEYGRKALARIWEARAVDASIQSETGRIQPEATLLEFEAGGDRADYTGILVEKGSVSPQAVRSSLGQGYLHRGALLAEDGMWEASLDAYRQAVATFEELSRDFPNDVACRINLATSERSLGQAYLASAGRPGAARSDLDQARAHLERARSIAVELAKERRLPPVLNRFQGQIEGDIAACETLLGKK